MQYIFEIEVGDDIPVEVIAEIHPGSPARLTGHPDNMHDGEPDFWDYDIFVDGKVASWEWERDNLTRADQDRIEAQIVSRLSDVKNGD